MNAGEDEEEDPYSFVCRCRIEYCFAQIADAWAIPMDEFRARHEACQLFRMEDIKPVSDD